MRPPAFRRTPREPTITLINIVFLTLIFFMVAGSLAATGDQRLMLVSAADLVATLPPDELLVLADGSLIWRGAAVTARQAVRVGEPVRIVPDRALPAARLIGIGRDLKAAGASGIIIVARRGTP